ncbi:SDR family NAD(P)-dependent oxidoreductase [Paenibacillus ferrarius]|uniref:SDR family NAD(P)-dependent oxidoreductase n=1 Tax=Paenibacillus ferrarius TaxID=1469647 RepID=UPI003D2E1A98
MANSNNWHTALITGANSGIGLALTKQLLQQGWHVAVLNRSDFPEDDRQIKQAIRDRSLRVYRADLADFSQLRAALQQIKSAETAIDVLFNNAGGSFPELLYSKQGRELHMELHTIVPYILTNELKELLLQGSMRTVVGTSTNAFATLKSFDPSSLLKPEAPFRKLFGPYATSKLALSLWVHEAAPEFSRQGIRLLSADPGGNNTLRPGNKSGLPFYLRPVMKLLFPPPSTGAGLLLDAATNRHPAGSYLVKNKPAALKFTQHGKEVLAMVDRIYKGEF